MWHLYLIPLHGSMWQNPDLKRPRNYSGEEKKRSWRHKTSEVKPWETDEKCESLSQEVLFETISQCAKYTHRIFLLNVQTLLNT